MKVIIVADGNGHTNAIAYNLENMRSCLKCIIKMGYISEHISDNMLTDECPIILANRFLNDEKTLPEQIEEFIDDQNITGRGKPLNIVEVEDQWQDYMDF